MGEKKGFGSRAEAFFAGKGFYIVLFACLAVIGVSAWVLLFSGWFTDEPEETDYTAVMADAGDMVQDEKPAAHNDLVIQPPEKEKKTEKVNEKPAKEPAAVQEISSDTAEAGAETAAPAPLTFIWPLAGGISAGYSPDELVYSKTMSDWRTHAAVDIEGRKGVKVLAVADGKVEKVYKDDLYGTTVVIDHGDGLESVYSNLAEVPTVTEGDAVTMGSVIGSVGDTAIAEADEVSHIHFAMTQDGKTIDPAEKLPKK